MARREAAQGGTVRSGREGVKGRKDREEKGRREEGRDGGRERQDRGRSRTHTHTRSRLADTLALLIPIKAGFLLRGKPSRILHLRLLLVCE